MTVSSSQCARLKKMLPTYPKRSRIITSIPTSRVLSLPSSYNCMFALRANRFGANPLIQLRTVEQPLKIPFIAAIVLHANVKKPDLAAEVLTKLGQTLQKYIDLGSWREVKLLLRFLACLQGMFEGEGVFTILEELFSRAVDLQTGSSEDVSSTTPCFN